MKENKINRAQQHFINALLELMEKKPFEEITVSELAMKAEYDRRTYYRYFNTMTDILRLYCTQILQEMNQMIMQSGKLTLHSGITSYYYFWKKYQFLLERLDQNGLLGYLEEEHDHLLYEAVGKVVQPEIPEEIENAPALSRYAYFFTTGGLWNILVWWCREGMKESPEALCSYIIACLKGLSETEGESSKKQNRH